MTRIFCCFPFSFFSNSKKNDSFCLDFLPEHLVIDVFNKMNASTFCSAYATCRRMAEIAEKGKSMLHVPIRKLVNLAIEMNFTDLSSSKLDLKISFPTNDNFSIVAFHSNIEEFPQLLKNFTFFKFNHIAIWPRPGSSSIIMDLLLQRFKHIGLHCESLFIDDPYLLRDFVKVLAPKQLNVRGIIVLSEEMLPRRMLSTLNICIEGFRPCSWSTVNENVVPFCHSLKLKIDDTSNTNILETVCLIEALYHLHNPKITVNVFLPRSVMQGHKVEDLFNHIPDIKCFEKMLVFPLLHDRACCVLEYSSKYGWIFRSFTSFLDLSQHLLPQNKISRGHTAYNPKIERLLEELTPLFMSGL